MGDPSRVFFVVLGFGWGWRMGRGDSDTDTDNIHTHKSTTSLFWGREGCEKNRGEQGGTKGDEAEGWVIAYRH